MKKPDKKVDKLRNKGEIITNLLWTMFGIINGIHFYSKEEYSISAITSLVGVLYAYKLIKSII